MSKELCKAQDCFVNQECMAVKWVKTIQTSLTDENTAKGQINYVVGKSADRECPNIEGITEQVKTLIQVIPQEVLPQ